MLALEWIQRCDACAELTPHRRVRIPVGWVVAALVGLSIAALLVAAGAPWPAYAVPLLLTVMTGRVWLRPPLACCRCEGVRQRELRRLRPSRGSEINLF